VRAVHEGRLVDPGRKATAVTVEKSSVIRARVRDLVSWRTAGDATVGVTFEALLSRRSRATSSARREIEGVKGKLPLSRAFR
jgi:hypothetical protein